MSGRRLEWAAGVVGLGMFFVHSAYAETDEETAAYNIGLIGGSLLFGALWGLLPLVVGLVRKQRVYAAVAFLACILLQCLVGIIGGLSVSIISTVVIVLLPKAADDHK